MTLRTPTGQIIDANGNRGVVLYDASGNPISSTVNADKDTNLDGLLGLNTNAMMFGRTDADTVKNIRLDAATDSQVSISQAHHERHEGDNFDTTINTTGTSLILAFQVATQAKQPHFTFLWKTEESSTVIFYKGATWTGGTGSVVTPNNVNDNSSTTSIMQGDSTGSFISNTMVQDPTGLAVGSATIKWDESLWSTNQTPASTGEGVRDENILLPGETYAIEITAISGGIWLHGDWYEHTPRN